MKMPKKNCLSMIICVIFLSACSTTGTKPTQIPDKQKEVTPPAEAMEKCSSLQKAQGPSREQLVQSHIEDSKQYYNCAKAHDKLIEFELGRQK